MTPGNNIYTLLITFIAFTSFFHLSFKLYFSRTNSHITLGPPVVSSQIIIPGDWSQRVFANSVVFPINSLYLKPWGVDTPARSHWKS